jgi:rhomboid protease GluP
VQIVTDPPPARPSRPAPPQFLFAKPWATRATLAIVVPVSLLAFYDPALLRLLAKDNDGLRAGQVWRLFTPGLVHGSLLHLAMNAFFLNDLGGLVERLFGRWRMVGILWGGVATGVAASFFWSEQPSVGISGGLFALVGAMLAQGVLNWRRIAPPARRMFVRGPIEIVVLNLALGLALPLIDNAGHLGGLAGGLVLGAIAGLKPDVLAVIAPEPRRPSPWGER